MESFDFVKMKPVKNVEPKNEAYQVYQLSDPGKQYAFYFEEVDQNKVTLDLPAGNYAVDIISVEDGSIKSLGKKNHTGGELQLDIADMKNFALRVLSSIK
jgi:hypothetical protein